MPRTAIITGSSRGIGAEIAQRLAKDGFQIVLTYGGSEAAARNVAAKIVKNGGKAHCVQVDVAKSADITRLFDEAERVFGGVDVLVNSAGVLKLGEIADYSDADFEQSFSINVQGTFLACREAAKRLRGTAEHGGRIINISSSVIGLRLPTYGIYAATKAAVETMAQFLAQEMRGRHITVNTIAPGPVATDLFLSDKNPELVARMAAMSPLGRLGQPDDIASVAAFLASVESGWINGQTLRVNGGIC